MSGILDPVTRERLARLIVDQDGPYERTGREIATLFRNAGWPDPVEYDGSYRVPWVDELLTFRAEDRRAIEQILCRMCDQREYEDPRSALAVRDTVNQIINADGLTVVYRDGQFTVIGVTPTAAGPAPTTPVELTVDVADFVDDPAMVSLLRSRLDEATVCREGGAYFAAIVTIGSLLEGVLHAVVQQREAILAAEGNTNVTSMPDPEGVAHQRTRDIGAVGSTSAGRPHPRPGPPPRGSRTDGGSRRSQPAPAARGAATSAVSTSASGRGSKDQPKLYDLIDAAHRHGLIKRDAKDFAQVLREYRNFVHPRSQLERNVHPDVDLATVCWNVAVMTLNDLGESHLPRSRP